MSSFGIMFGAVPFLIGVVLIRSAYVTHVTTGRFNETAVATIGVVRSVTIEDTSHGDADGMHRSSSSYALDLEFSTADSQSVTARTSIPSHPPSPEIGTVVTLRYDPTRRTSIRLGADPSSSNGPAMLGTIGAGLIVLGVVLALTL